MRPSRSPTIAAPGGASPHSPSLDGVRGVAILLVVAHHAFPSAWTAVGWTGVDLFFVLSGFLITGILADGRDDAHRARTFYVRRTLRIMPLYYGVLLVLFVVVPLVHRPDDPVYNQIARDQWWYWTYTSNWLMGLHRPHFDYTNHFWSLAVEEQFYLVWPLIVWHTRRETAMRVAAAAIVGALVCRIVLAASGVWWMATYFLTPCRLDALAVGSLVALALRAPGEDPKIVAERVGARMRRGAIVVAAALVLSVAIGQHGILARIRLPETINLTALAWIFGWLVTVAVTREPRALRSRALRTAGLYSYGLYVLHPFVIAYLSARWPHSHGTVVGGAVAVIMSSMLAWMSYHAFEKHFLRLKSVLAPVRGTRAPSLSPAPPPRPTLGIATAVDP